MSRSEELARALSVSQFGYLPTGYEIPAREERPKTSELGVIEWPVAPSDHSRVQTDIRGQEGPR